MTKNNFFKTLLLTAAMSSASLNAQVTIGSDKEPEGFSILELISNGSGGLRLPQMTTAQRDTLDGTTPSTGGSARMIAAAAAFQREKADKAQGLMFFNIDSNCIEVWNGAVWVAQCQCGSVPCCPENTPAAPSGNSLTLAYEQNSGTKNIVTDAGLTAESTCRLHWYAREDADVFDTIVPPTAFSTTSLGTTEYWVAQWRKPCESPRLKVTVNVLLPFPDPTGGRWTGAFWKNSQTGERVIYAVNNYGNWRVEVTPSSGGLADDVVLAAGRSADPNYLTDSPGDAESYQVPGNLTEVSGTGNILFRIGLKSANPGAPAEDDPFDYTNGRLIAAPRYATLTLTVDGDADSPYTLYLRQGEAADYVFRPTDNMNGGTNTASGKRDLAVKFSAYNLTDPTLTDADGSVATPYRGAVFVDYPTKAGAFWQWGTDLNGGGKPELLRHAYHPINSVGSWDSDNDYAAGNRIWNQFTGANLLETAPPGYRRPIVGDTTSNHATQAASGSELMQSLFYNTFNSINADISSNNNANSDNNRYWGYYADGYFDRRSHTHSKYGANGTANTAVSITTKDVAYIGLLFTNPATNASLFIPAGGLRYGDNSRLDLSGTYGRYWTSSSVNATESYYLDITSSTVGQARSNRADGFWVRPVKE